jgi:hypothetical protein
MSLSTKGDWGRMTRLDEIRLNKRADEEMRGHRGLKNGRDFRWNCYRWRGETEAFRRRFDQTFKGAPGSPEWLSKEFCPVCDRRWAFCECGGGVE